MDTRTQVINYLIKKYNYKKYLEIGVKHPIKNFDSIQCEHKEGVDPNGTTTHKMKSDDYFESCDDKWDLIFIDGNHEREQVTKDIENALGVLNKGGVIVCHDVNPKEEYLLQKRYCWNAWESFAELRYTREDLEMYTLPFDHLGIIRRGTQQLYPRKVRYTWNFLQTNRVELMNEITLEEFLEKF